MNETQLKECIKGGKANLYVFYGAEGYLVEQYARLVAKHTVEEGFDAFNLQRFDGQTTPVEQIEAAVDAMPVMSDRKCVLVRDADLCGVNSDRLRRLAESVPEDCVLVFWQMTAQPDTRKSAWKAFAAAAEKSGVVMNFPRKDAGDAARMLVGGAKRRGCALDMEDARYLVEQVGNDLNLLICELDKLCALAPDGTITKRMIDDACPKNLEAKVFDLSKAILRRRHGEVYDLLYQLKTQREEPVAVLGVLSSAYADLYRGKVATAAGMPTDQMAAAYKSYAKKEWKLRNAARDSARMSVPALRDCLEILADADTHMKRNYGGDNWLVLEHTVTRLIKRAQEG